MFEKPTFKLLSWIEAHETTTGEYLDNANHPIWGVENRHRLPHTFHYYGIIKGYLQLYSRFGEPAYLQKAEAAGAYLCSLQKPNGQYLYDTFEFNSPKPQGLTLIHNALPSSALLELYQHTNNKRYLATAKKNIHWFVSRLWNGKYLTGCGNQDLCAAEALLRLYTVEKKDVYKQRALSLADLHLQLQIQQGDLTGGFLRGFHEQDLVIPWYDAKTASRYAAMDDLLHTERYASSIRSTLSFLQKNLSRRGLHHWYLKHKNAWTSAPQPYLIAPAGLVLDLFSRYKLKTPFDFTDYQQADGSFPLASWYTDYRKLPNLGWNQFMFLYLTQQVKKQLPLSSPTLSPPTFSEGKHLSYTGTLQGYGKRGYIDILQNHFALASTPLSGKSFKLFTALPDSRLQGASLRFRMESALIKTIQPSEKHLKVRLYPYFFKLPYVIFENIYTRLMTMLFTTKLFDLLAKLRVWKK